MFQISNHQLTVTISAQGAELQSIYHKTNALEYMWSGDPAFWGKKSPVLFPIVGGLKNNQYRYQGNSYALSRHGFAREREFKPSHQTEQSIRFNLVSDEKTKSIYPFDFIFSIEYSLRGNELFVKYIVENVGNTNLFFSVGAHPAFKVPLIDGTSFEDYHLLFGKHETAGIYPLSNDGLIEENSQPLLLNANILPLTKSLFYKDALVFKNLQSESIAIVSNKSAHGLKLHYSEFPYMGIWAAKNADFVCIEPWCGIADSVDATGDLSKKEGIHELMPNALFERVWSVEVF